jgi:hypothetical protein
MITTSTLFGGAFLAEHCEFGEGLRESSASLYKEESSGLALPCLRA